jgi:hypothetical protein
VERNKERDGFPRLRWGETKEQGAVGGARFTIEIGAEFPTGINYYAFLLMTVVDTRNLPLATRNLDVSVLALLDDGRRHSQLTTRRLA